MKRIRGACAALALLASTLCAGCGDLGSFVYFLLPEQKVEPDLKHLGTAEKGKDVKAMILVRALPLETRSELIGADRELAVLLHEDLKEACQQNEERLTLVAPEKVESFKSSRPEWYQLRPVDIGQHFQVDYIILLEINSLGLYEGKSHESIYRGKTDISVKLVDVKHPDDSPPRRDFNCSFPSEAYYEVVEQDVPSSQFRTRYLKYVAKHLTWMFQPHPQRDSHDLE